MRTWSVSSVKGFHTCQLQWWFRRQGLKEEFRALPLVEGTVLHAALASHLKGMQASKVPEEGEIVEQLDADLFAEETAGEIRWGRVGGVPIVVEMCKAYPVLGFRISGATPERGRIRLEGQA